MDGVDSKQELERDVIQFNVYNILCLSNRTELRYMMGCNVSERFPQEKHVVTESRKSPQSQCV